MDPDQPVRIVSSRGVAARNLATFASFAAVGAWLVASGRAPLAGWIGIAFFGGLGAFFVRPALASRVVLVIDRDGIEDRRLSCGPFRWEHVTGARLRSVSRQPMLCLDLGEHRDRYLSGPWQRWVAGASRALGCGDAGLLLGGLSAEPDEVLAHVARLRRFGVPT